MGRLGVSGLAAEVPAHVGAMDLFVAARSPAGSAIELEAVDEAANPEHIRRCGLLLLEVALEAQVAVALGEHFLVHGTVRAVAGGASFTEGIVFKHEGAALLGMAVGAEIVHAGEAGTSGPDRRSLVGVVTVGAGHLAGEDGMAERHAELGFLVEMALEAGFRGFSWIDDGTLAAARFDVQAARSVAGFAAHVDGIGSLGLEFRVISGFEIRADLVMTRLAFFRTDVGGTRDAGWCHQDA